MVLGGEAQYGRQIVTVSNGEGKIIAYAKPQYTGVRLRTILIENKLLMNENCYFVENDSHIFYLTNVPTFFSFRIFGPKFFFVNQDALN